MENINNILAPLPKPLYLGNHLDNLPTELHYYIGDIIESDRKFKEKEWNKKKEEVGQMLTEKFIRTDVQYFNEEDRYIEDSIEEQYEAIDCSCGSNFIRFHKGNGEEVFNSIGLYFGGEHVEIYNDCMYFECLE